MSSELKDPQFHARLQLLIGKEQPFAWAARVGISKGAFHRIWNEGTVPGPDHLRRIREATGASIDWLLTGEAPMRRGDEQGHGESREDFEGYRPALFVGDEYVVPRYDVQASAGGGALVHAEQIVDYLAFKAEWLREHVGISPKNAVVISVAGDSMEPALSDGDLILVDTSIQRFEQDAIYVLQVGGVLMVKRVQVKLDGTVIVKSDNERYEAEIFRGEEVERLRVIGRMVRRVVR